MMKFTSIEQLQNATVYDIDGAEVGTVTQVYLDDDTSEPTFASVHTGRSADQSTWIPLSEATQTEHGLTVPFRRDAIQGAPDVEDDGSLTPEQEDRILAYYRAAAAEGDGRRRDQSAESDDDAVILRNEEVDVRTERRATGLIRLRKRTYTEMKTIEVPVTREELIVEREEIDPDSPEALSGDTGRLDDLADLQEGEVVIKVYEDVPVVGKRVTAERVHVDKNVVHGTETVTETVRQEDVEVDQQSVDDRRP